MVSLRLCLIIVLTALPVGESKQFLEHIADIAAGDLPAETLPNAADEGPAAADSTGESDESDDSLTAGVPMDEEMNARVEAMDVDDTDDSSAATAADSADNAADTVADKPMEAPSLLQTDDSEDTEDDEAYENEDDESETEDEEVDDSETEDVDGMADEEETDEETDEDGGMNEEEQAEIEESEMEEDEANN